MPALRTPDLKEAPPPSPQPSRLQRLKDLICYGAWAGQDDLVLIYWNKQENRWVAWVDGPTPKVDPLPEAGVTVSP
jgi:hypothetical protein